MKDTAQKHQPLVTTIYKDGGEWIYQIRRINGIFPRRRGIQIAELNKATNPEYHAKLFSASEDMLRVLEEIMAFEVKGIPDSLKKKIKTVIEDAKHGKNWLKFTPESIEGEIKKPNEH